MESLWQDIRFGIRTLRKTPGFTIASLIALGLGIGASIAIFSIVNTILLRSLPYESPDRIVLLREKTSQEDLPTSYLNFVDWRDQNQVFEKMAGFRNDNFNLTGEGEPERLESMTVTSDFLSTLGIKPMLGRDFVAEDDRQGAAPVVILSHGLWQRRFGSDRNLVGKQITLNKQSFTVIGITPAGFKFGQGGDILSPLGLMAERFKQRGKDAGISVVARLKPEVTPEQGRADMETIMSRLVEQYPEVLAGRRILFMTLDEYMVGNVRPTLLVLMGAVGFVLLIACTNVANLLLARASSKQKEIAIRTALGAGRSRLIQQFLTESVLLSIAGGMLGLLLAYMATPLLTAFSPGNIPRMDEIQMDNRVLGFTLLLSLLTGIIYGIFPAIQASKPDLISSLKEASRGSTENRSRTRSALVIAEVALALVLLIGGGLMIKSFWYLQNVDPGFDARNLLTIQIAISANKGEGSKVSYFLDQLEQRIEKLPGVTAIAFSNGLPFTGSNQLPLNVDGRVVDNPGQNPIAAMYITSPDYFQVMNIRSLKGRTFSSADTRDSTKVAVIDEVLAQKYFPEEDPIGKRFSLAIQSPDPIPLYEIVGIVEHVKSYGLDGQSPVQPQFYLNFSQVPEQNLPSRVRRLNVIVRAQSDPLSLASPIRQQVMSIDRDQPVYNMRTMESKIYDTIAVQKFSMLLLSIFAFVALALAAVGIYGVMAYSVSRRRHEIGIRMVLGAQTADIFRLVIGQGMTLAFIGLGIGLVAAFVLTRVLSSLLYQVSAKDPIIFIAISLLLAAVALLANFIPARRATRVDPMVVLKYE
jgi:putative ABC transport system permease protein